MPFRHFHDEFPELAKMETRSIRMLPGNDYKLPPADYAFMEMFCDESGCDCRRVFFCVRASSQPQECAVIAWGWENLKFYETWLKHGDRRDAKLLRGPILNHGSPVTKISPLLLTLVREVLLKDEEYVARVKRHYQMFRDRIDKPKGNASDLLKAILSENNSSLITRSLLR